MKIKTKLLLIISILVISIVGIGSSSVYMINSTTNQNNKLMGKMEIQKQVLNIQFRLAGLSNDERAYIITGDTEFANGMREKATEITKTIKDIKGVVNDESYNSSIDSLDKNFNDFWAMNQLVIKTYESDPQGAKNIHFGEERTLRKEVLDPSINKLVADLNKEVNELNTSNESQASRSQFFLLLTSIISSIVGVILGILLLKSILNPLRVINVQLEKIATGEADLTKRVEIKGKNEFGQLAHSFNSFVESLREIMIQIGSSSEQVAASSEELSASTEQSKVTSKQVSESIQSISSANSLQNNLTVNSLNSVNESLRSLIVVSTNTNNVVEFSSTMKGQAEKGASSVEKMLEQMQFINKSVDLADKGILSLVSSATEIREVSSLITEISDQTNLLALNAAIEAARAGEHGKGFAVVAEEVRKLADETNKSANHIQRLVSTIQNESNETVNNIQSVRENVSSGITISQETVLKFNEILDSIEQVTSQIQEVATTTGQLTTDFDLVKHSIDGIAEGSKETLDSTENVAASTEEQLASIEEISYASNSLSTLAEELQSMISRFKV